MVASRLKACSRWAARTPGARLQVKHDLLCGPGPRCPRGPVRVPKVQLEEGGRARWWLGWLLCVLTPLLL